MKTLKSAKDYEQHSLNSLAKRLKLLVSRTTLKKWLENGNLVPAMQTRLSRNSHLLFTTSKLDQLLALLEQGYRERLGRLAKTNAEVLRYRAAAEANALRIFEGNAKRRAEGLSEYEEPDPALNDNAARGVVTLKHTPAREKNTFTISSGYGAWKTNKTKTGGRQA